MLFPDNINPEDCIYYNSSIIIKKLLSVKKIEITNLYKIIIKEKEMAFSVYVLCLDWLYLLNKIKVNDSMVEIYNEPQI